jgi:hypothetical protein
MKFREQVDRLVMQLEPITDWSKVKEGEHIFHESSNTVFLYDIFMGINSDGDIVSYLNRDGEEYTLSASSWYYYDYGRAKKIARTI